MQDIHVVKKDGTMEVYDEPKIVRVAVATGLTPEEGQNLAANVTKWISDNSFSTVKSIDIRNKVVDGLKAVNTRAADFYLWYEKRKDENLQVK